MSKKDKSLLVKGAHREKSLKSIAHLERGHLARECEKLNPKAEQALADEGLLANEPLPRNFPKSLRVSARSSAIKKGKGH